VVDDPFGVKDGAEAVAQLLSCGLMAIGWLSGIGTLFATDFSLVPSLISWGAFGIGVTVNHARARRVAKRAGLRPFRRWSFLTSSFTKINSRRRLRETFRLARSESEVIRNFLAEYRSILVTAVAGVAIVTTIAGSWFGSLQVE